MEHHQPTNQEKGLLVQKARPSCLQSRISPEEPLKDRDKKINKSSVKANLKHLHVLRTSGGAESGLSASIITAGAGEEKWGGAPVSS